MKGFIARDVLFHRLERLLLAACRGDKGGSGLGPQSLQQLWGE